MGESANASAREGQTSGESVILPQALPAASLLQTQNVPRAPWAFLRLEKEVDPIVLLPWAALPGNAWPPRRVQRPGQQDWAEGRLWEPSSLKCDPSLGRCQCWKLILHNEVTCVPQPASE